MKQFAVLGLGNFGYNLAVELAQAGHEVFVLDADPEKIESIKEFVNNCVISDVKDVATLDEFVKQDVDAVILNLGDPLEENVLATIHLQERGIRTIIVKVMNETQGRILKKLGASEVIIPEKESAKHMANRLSIPNLIDFLPLAEEYAIFEVAVAEKFVGKTIRELNLRKKYHVNIIAVKDVIKEKMIVNPDPDFALPPDSVIYVLGKKGSLNRLKWDQ